jgi:uridine kinase
MCKVISQDAFWDRPHTRLVDGQHLSSEEEVECTNWERLRTVVRERVESQKARSQATGAPMFVFVEGFLALHDKELSKTFDHVFHLCIRTDTMCYRV